MIKTISEKTLLPISLVITLSGGVFWLTSMYSKQEALAKDFEVTKDVTVKRNDKIENILSDIQQRVARIEEAVKRR